MNQGLIEKLKMMYKNELCRLLLAEDNEENVLAFSKILNLKRCSHTVAYSWRKVIQTNLQNKWGNQKIPTNKDDHLQRISNILLLIQRFSDCDQADVQALLENDNDPGYRIMDENDILCHMQHLTILLNPRMKMMN